MYTIDQIFGTSTALAAPNALDPSQLASPSAAYAVAPGQVADGEPGGGTRPRGVHENPITWLIAFLGIGIALFAYGTDKIG